ncbi:MAG TPA: Flp pilus assembly protein CpaB [Bauldia sp.]|nr:Flp pilus assembly protein CpaB [Bauldia sp.]HVZ15031.1 Flp pilus assembly protein CpaB [Bauldia sp.]
MKITRVAVLAVAVIAGLIAAFIAMRLSAPRPAPVVATAQAPAAPVTSQVLVATKDIPVGGRLDAASMSWQDWPNSGVSDHFITKQGDGSQQLQPLVGSIARATIYSGEPINQAKLINSDRGYMSAILPAGMRAVALKISTDTSAGGFILPNDRVDVIMTRQNPDASTNGGNPYLTETILNNVRVLAIDQTVENKTDSSTSGSDSGETVIGQTATLELTPQQVQILAVAQQMSDRLTLALRSVADSHVTPKDAAADAVHLIGSTKENGAVTVVRNGVAHDVSVMR